jgi:proteasome lid subunit RPN8/RPN11
MGQGVYHALYEVGQKLGVAERCGVLFGVVDEDGAGWVAGSAELDNVHRDPMHHYEFSPRAQAKAWERIETWGYQVLAVWHTHPGGPTGPSETDLAYAQPWLLYPVITRDLETGSTVLSVCAINQSADRGYVVVPYEVNSDVPSEALRMATEKARQRAQHGRQG